MVELLKIHMSSGPNSHKWNKMLVRGLEKVELFDFEKWCSLFLRGKGGGESGTVDGKMKDKNTQTDVIYEVYSP